MSACIYGKPGCGCKLTRYHAGTPDELAACLRQNLEARERGWPATPEAEAPAESDAGDVRRTG